MLPFIAYRRIDKAPVDYRTGKPANAHDPNNWATQEQIAALGPDFGLGAVLTEGARIAVIDVDGCRDPQTGAISATAQALISMLPGAYVEISISGRGIHIWFSYTGVMPQHAARTAGVGEFYHRDRYICIGAPYEAPGFTQGSLSADQTAVLPLIIAAFFPAGATVAGGDEFDLSAGPCEGWNGPTDDGELLRRAMQTKSAASAFAGKASFSDLWLRNVPALAESYPDAKGREFDESAADSALAKHLCFWTGEDGERIERLMRQSGLVRDKYDRDDYLPRTINRAIAVGGDVLQDKLPGVTSGATSEAGAALSADGIGAVEAPRPRGGSGFITREQALEHFKGCVYIESMNRALTPDGAIIKPDAFSVRYGGFSFVMGEQNDKVSEDAWKAWTQNKAHTCVTAFSTCFRPELPLGSIVTRNGQRYVNTYVPLNIERKAGDASPFLNHLAKLLPDQRDAQIFLSYMAACVQHQGTKFQWAPMLQGVQGNGKSFFSYCVEAAVGPRYTHWPKAKKLAKDFNNWMTGKVFYAVEDIYVPDSKREVMEDLKPMITGRSMEIEAKGVDQVTADICGNFIFNSNHKDGVIKSDSDRRFCMLFTAQQSIEDLARDGMIHNDYMKDLYGWLRQGGGFAIVNEFLFTYPIAAEFNPARDCQRAPFTTSSVEAIRASKGTVEQEIEEAIEQGLQGFCGGWISSIMFDRHLENAGMASRISRGKRRQVLDEMGYIVHPSLPGGRVNNVVTPDNSRPRLYIHKTDAMLRQIENPAAIAKSYETTNRVATHMPFANRA